jgi:membrane protease YdiL (CAAX protease family)
MKFPGKPLLFMLLLVFLYFLTLVFSSTTITQNDSGYTISINPSSQFPERVAVGKFIFLILMLVLPSRRLFSNAFQKPEIDSFQVLIMLFWGISFIAFSWNIGYIIFPGQAEIEISQIFQMYDTGDNTSKIFTLISIGILSPIIEELIFRDVLPFTENYKYTSLFVSTIGFALIHGTILLISFTLLLGFFLGWMIIQGYSIHFAIIIHGIVNISSRYIGDLFLNTLNLPSMMRWIVTIFLLGILLLLTRIMIKGNSSTHRKEVAA